MPGFNIAPLGGGDAIGGGPSNVTEIRRQHRWVFETLGRGQGAFSNAELLVLQSASRPSFKFEQPEMHHNQEVIRLAGKQDWEPIAMVWYDQEQNPDVSKGIYYWLETVVNMKTIQVNHPTNYKRNASLAVIDGTGQPSERWSMFGTWPVEVNWNELNYTETDLLTIEATMRFDRAIRGNTDGSCPPVNAVRLVPANCPV